MKKEDNSMITTWLKNNSDPKIEIKVLNEAIDKLIEQLQIAYLEQDKFAIEFAEWLLIDPNINQFQYSYKDLLEQFKREKGL